MSVSLTAVNSLVVLVTLPLIVHFGLNYFIGLERNIHLNVYSTIVNILITIILPIIIGMMIRNYFFRFAIKMQKPLRFILPLILFIVFLDIVIIFYK